MVKNIDGKIVTRTLNAINTYNTHNVNDMMKNTFEVTEDIVGNSQNLQNVENLPVNTNTIASAVKGTIFDLIV